MLGLLVRHLKESWVPVALVSGTGALAAGLFGGTLVLWAVVAAAIGASTRPEVLRRLRGLSGGRTKTLGAAWLSGALMLVVAVGPAAWMSGSSQGWSALGLGLFLQTVYLAAGCFPRRGGTLAAIVITCSLVVFLALVGMTWVGFRYAAAIGAEPLTWVDLTLWWGLAVVVPVAALGAAWVRLGRKDPVDPNGPPDNASDRG